jgi:hypothetical protein
LRLLLHDLAATGFITVREAYFHNTVDHEFFINLTTTGEGPPSFRDELVALADAERRSPDVPAFA